MVASLAVIGAGNMGRAIIDGILDAHVIPAEELLVVDMNQTPRRELAERGCVTTDRPLDAITRDQMMLAVKPQSFPHLAGQIGTLTKPTVIITIMAGLHSSTIREALGENARVVRVMPNTPCRARAGMAAVALGEGAKPGDEELAMRIFESIGRAELVDESQMHAVTAVSGSGPAYVFLLAEAMQQAGVELGLDESTAAALARQTITGAGRLLAESSDSPAALREAVTSPGGTTEAAVNILLERGLPEMLAEAITAARDRSEALEQPGDASTVR